MKRFLWTSLFALFLLLITSCSPEEAQAPIPAISLNTLDASEKNLVKASAVVVPVHEIQLSFVISGLVEDVVVKEGDQVTAGQMLAKVDTSNLEYDLIAAKAALISAEIDAQMQRQRSKQRILNTFNFIHASPPAEKILIADTKVEQAQFAIEVVKASMVQGTLTSPTDATVISVEVLPGEYITPGQVVIVLAKLDNLIIETTDLSELSVDKVKVGQTVTVFIEALGEEFPGKVTAISPISNTVGGDVVFKVTIQLNKKPNTLLWGMSADVEIDVE